MHAQMHTHVPSREQEQKYAVSSSFMDQIITGNTGTVQSVGTTPRKAVQHVFVPPKLGARGDYLSVLLLHPMGKDWQIQRATLVP